MDRDNFYFDFSEKDSFIDQFLTDGDHKQDLFECILNQCDQDAQERVSSDSQEIKTGQKASKEKRNNQNHIRTLNRKILKFLKLNKIYAQISYSASLLIDKRLTFVICRTVQKNNLYEDLKIYLRKAFSKKISETSKDFKLLEHLKILLNFTEADFIDLNLENAFQAFRKAGQIKDYPLREKKFRVDEFLEFQIKNSS